MIYFGSPVGGLAQWVTALENCEPKNFITHSSTSYLKDQVP